MAQSVTSNGAFAETRASSPDDYLATPSQRMEWIRNAGHPADAAIQLIELWNSWDFQHPKTIVDTLDTLADSRLHPEVRSLVTHYQQQAALRMGRTKETQENPTTRENPTTWEVSPRFTPEEAQQQEQDPKGMTWITVPALLFHGGSPNLQPLLAPERTGCAYVKYTVPTNTVSEKTALVSLGANGSVRAWWNGIQILDQAEHYDAFPNRHRLWVDMQPGENELLVRTCVKDRSWKIWLSTVNAPTIRRRTPYPSLWDTVQGWDDTWSTGERERVLRFQYLTGTYDNRDTLWTRAKRLVDEKPTPTRIDLALRIAQRSSQTDHIRNLVTSSTVGLHPDSRRWFTARTWLNTPLEHEVVPLLSHPPEQSNLHLQWHLTRARVLNRHDMPRSALAELQKVPIEKRHVPAYWHTHREAADNVGLVALGITGLHKQLELEPGNPAPLRALARWHAHRNEQEQAEGLIEALLEVASHRVDTHLFALKYSSKEPTSRRAALIATFANDPEVQLWAARQATTQGNTPVAIEHLRSALERDPQHRHAKKLLAQLQQSSTDPLAQHLGPEELPPYPDASPKDHGITLLQNITVETVETSGLSDQTTRLTYAIHTDDGARDLSSYAIPYDPEQQEVRVVTARVHHADGSTQDSSGVVQEPMGRPWHRMFYNRQASVILFPQLQPGDLVDIQYQRYDIRRHPGYGTYFGTLQVAGGGLRTEQWKYVLRHPPEMNLRIELKNHSSQQAPPIQHETKSQGAYREHTFTTTHLPEGTREHHARGAQQRLPYVHISTFQTWQQLGQWWWDLIKEQLVATPELEGVVQNLTENLDLTAAEDRKTATQRIYGWVLDNTRYVGLELGIHSHKPYSISRITERGYGDCKDKASLLYILLRHAGIPTDLVLLRTTRHGPLTDDVPSLAVFDHAIAYVPEFKLYLDGTAEHHGSQELPSMDRGASVLHVGPRPSHDPNTAPRLHVERHETPEITLNHVKHGRKITVNAFSDTTATAEIEETLNGDQAAGYRRQLAPTATRQERLERILQTAFPGASISNVQSVELERESTVRLIYNTRIPNFIRKEISKDAHMISVPVRHQSSSTGVQNLVNSLAPEQSRTQDLIISIPVHLEHSTLFTLPNSYEWSNRPAQKKQQIESQFGTVKVEMRRNDADEAHIQYEVGYFLAIPATEISAREYPKFRDWLQRVDLLLNEQLEFSSTPGEPQL